MYTYTIEQQSKMHVLFLNEFVHHIHWLIYFSVQ